MPDNTRPKRKGKQLLVASVGVATVSYLALQGGCVDEADIPLVANLLAPPWDASIDTVTTGDAALPADAALDALVVSGNLLPPPPPDAATDALTTSGNLLPPPPPDAAMDALTTSGNLLPPPPPDATVDAAPDAAARDAKVDTGLPTSGNLLPPPRDEKQ
jgi:hypothetical protein